MCKGDRSHLNEVRNALDSLDFVELPRRASQVEPLPYPLDGLIVAKAWGCSEPAPGTATQGLQQRQFEDPLDWILRSAIRSAFSRLETWLAQCLQHEAASLGFVLIQPALERLISQGYTEPLYRLSARAIVAAFLQLKLEAALAPNATFSDALELHSTELRLKVTQSFPRLRPRAKHLAISLVRDMRCLLARVQADRDTLIRLLEASSSLQAIEGISLLGDPHGIGGRVTSVKFRTDSGLHEFIYKPRSLDVDDAFYALAQRLGKEDGQDFVRPWVVKREGYGWMQHFGPLDCQAHSRAEAYYVRLGWLTALVNALSGRDCHAGNVIAYGEHPVFVDLECLLTPGDARDGDHTSVAGIPVTATGVIPMVRFAIGDFKGIDASAFSGGRERKHFYSDWHIVFDEPSAPRAERRRAAASSGSNVPTIGGQRVNPFAYTGSFIAGFKRGYRCIARARQRFAEVGGLLSAFSGTRTRVVIRNTSEYFKAIAESTAPSVLISRGAEIAHFHRCLGGRNGTAPDDEIRSLINGWIPRFEIRAESGGSVGLPGQDDPGLRRSGLDYVRTNLTNRLSEANLDEQVRLIQHCIGAMALNDGQRRNDPPGSLPSAGLKGVLEEAVARLNEGRRLSSNPDWLSYECSRAGTLVASRSHWGSFTGIAGIIGTYLELETLDAPGANADVVEQAMAFLSNHRDIVQTLPAAGLNGQASFVLLDAMARRSGRHNLASLRQQAVQEINSHTRPLALGLNGLAGTMLLLEAANRASPELDIHTALTKQLDTAVNSAAFRSLENDARSNPELLVTWSAPWTQLLAITRAANAIDRTDLVERCARVVLHSRTTAPTSQDRLLRALLRLEIDPVLVEGISTPEIRLIACDLFDGHPASQYGIGALVGIICRLDGTGIADCGYRSKLVARYVHQAASAVSAACPTSRPDCTFYDVARGMSGIVLRLAQLYAKSCSPASVIF